MAEKHFVGLAGQLAVLGELAFRGYGVSIPAPDEGDDVVVHDKKSSRIWRIQVKTARARRQKNSHTYQFAVAEAQITKASKPDRFFALVMRRGASFHPIVLSRAALKQYTKKGFGTLNKKQMRTLTLNFADTNTVKFGAGKTWTDVTKHLRDFSFWPRGWKAELKPTKGSKVYKPLW